MRFALAALLIAIGGGCRAAAPPDGAPHPYVAPSATPAPVIAPSATKITAAAWNGQGDFELHYTDFHFELGGTQVISIGTDGRVRDLFVRHAIVKVDAYCKNVTADLADVCADLRKHGEKEIGTTSWFLATYPLTAAERADLRARVTQARLASLDAHYEQKGLEDGTTNTYRLVSAAGSTEVSVYTGDGSNVPAELRPLIQFLRGLETTHAADRERAPKASAAEQLALLRAARGT